MFVVNYKHILQDLVFVSSICCGCSSDLSLVVLQVVICLAICVSINGSIGQLGKT